MKGSAVAIMGEHVYQQMLETRALAASREFASSGEFCNSLRPDEPSLGAVTPDEKSWLVKAFHHLKQIDEGRSKARPGNKPYCIFEVDEMLSKELAADTYSDQPAIGPRLVTQSQSLRVV